MNRAAAPDDMAVKQQDLGLNLNKRRTRKAVLLDEKNLAVSCSGLLALISPHAPRAKTGRAPFELETMLRIHFVRQWFGLSEPAMPEALFETALYRGFVGLSSVERIPERVSILRLRRLLKEHQPAEQILAAVNATLTGKGLMFREGAAVDAALMCLPMRFTRAWPSAKIRKASLPSGMWSCARVSAVRWTRARPWAPSCTSWSRPRRVSGPRRNTHFGDAVCAEQSVDGAAQSFAGAAEIKGQRQG